MNHGQSLGHGHIHHGLVIVVLANHPWHHDHHATNNNTDKLYYIISYIIIPMTLFTDASSFQEYVH